MSFVDADRWAKLIELNPRYRGHVEMARFDKKGRVGTWTTEDKKKAFMLEMQRTLPTLKYATQFVTGRADVEGLKKDFVDQMRTFRLDVVAPKGEDSTALTSKFHITGKSAGKKDDLMMAFGIGVYHAIVESYDPAFQAKMRSRHKCIVGG